MKIKYYLLTLLVMAMTFIACEGDDGLVDPVDANDRTEQQVEDKADLIDYLESHYYNSGFFDGNDTPSIADIIITELEDGATVPADHTLLIDDIRAETTTYLDVVYEYYILEINKGGGEVPNFTDKVRLNYSGSLLDGDIFDSSVNPVEFDLVSLIVGWSRVLPQFKAAVSYVENGDGTISFEDSGVGVMFLPSGLAYFSEPNDGIPAYSQLIFKFELFQTEVNDHDFDGIPSYLEDLNNNQSMSDDDTDDNAVPNFVDPDDDGDGVLTINELEPKEYIVDTNQGDLEPILGAKEYELNRTDDNGVITINTVKIMDSNNDGLDDYLDANITVNYNDEDS